MRSRIYHIGLLVLLYIRLLNHTTSKNLHVVQTNLVICTCLNFKTCTTLIWKEDSKIKLHRLVEAYLDNVGRFC